jgi:hypothetical protein
MPSPKQVDKLAVLVGLEPPLQWAQKQLTDMNRRDMLIRNCGEAIGAQQFATRSTGKSTVQALVALWMVLEGKDVAFLAHTPANAEMFVRMVEIWLHQVPAFQGKEHGSIRACCSLKKVLPQEMVVIDHTWGDPYVS